MIHLTTAIHSFDSVKDLAEGKILLIDKPLGWTSFDVVNKVKWAIKRKSGKTKIKVGHAGTLDPLATGLLVICTGKMTKQISQWANEDKAYLGTLKLGSVTPSFDLETEPCDFKPADHITLDDIESETLKLTGIIDQVPPVFSAKKVDGKRAFDLAREGKNPEMKGATVTIRLFEIIEIRGLEVDFKVLCSKGTYIRSLAHDLGQALGCGAHLTGLCRTASGSFDLSEAKSVDDIVRAIDLLPNSEIDRD
jgi:tRNA pseudouridine55 synthase